ncbi:MAG: DUF6265 family protein [Phycisphaerales bacterium]|nr:DUF6265 family protein [Phycisphaerales bacterium]
MSTTLKSLVLIIALIATSAAGGKVKQDPKKQIAGMRWIAGTWEGKMWGGTFVAYYTTPDGGKVMSYSKLLKKGVIAFHEFEVFEIEDGKVVFNPFPGGKRATSLTLTECDPAAKRVIFENAKKDFPTRIVYHRVTEDNLVITLSDPHNDTDRIQKFDLKRKKP